jgi:hypothetical protein
MPICGRFTCRSKTKLLRNRHKRPWNSIPGLIGPGGLTQLNVINGNQEKAEEELIRAIDADPENEALLHVMGTF